MVYLTGDTHGDLDRFKHGKLRWLTKRDTVIVLGDFGFVWDGSKAEQKRLAWLCKRPYTILFLDGSHENYDLLAAYPIVLGDFGFVWDGSKAEQKRLAWLCKRPYTILFLDGSHENYDLLAAYPTEEKFGGLVQHLGGNVYHVCRGSVLELEGQKYLCFGGAESPDREEREPGVNWWPQEQPSDEEYARCEQNLAAAGGQVEYLCFGGAESPDREEREPGVNWWPQEQPSDEEYARCEQNLAAAGGQVEYVLTHDAPSRFLDFTALKCGETNRLHLFLDSILLKAQYEKWFFGCYHKDAQLSTKSRCVFCDVIPLGDRHAKRK